MFPFQFSDSYSNLNLVMSAKARWKRMRNVLNPTFSPAKLKEVLDLNAKKVLFLVFLTYKKTLS